MDAVSCFRWHRIGSVLIAATTGMHGPGSAGVPNSAAQPAAVRRPSPGAAPAPLRFCNALLALAIQPLHLLCAPENLWIPKSLTPWQFCACSVLLAGREPACAATDAALGAASSTHIGVATISWSHSLEGCTHSSSPKPFASVATCKIWRQRCTLAQSGSALARAPALRRHCSCPSKWWVLHARTAISAAPHSKVSG